MSNYTMGSLCSWSAAGNDLCEKIHTIHMLFNTMPTEEHLSDLKNIIGLHTSIKDDDYTFKYPDTGGSLFKNEIWIVFSPSVCQEEVKKLLVELRNDNSIKSILNDIKINVKQNV